jgi:type III pantothenate kinase
LGGAISPGIQLRYKSLHDYTAKLPLLEPEMPNNQIGRSTKNAIHSGVINGVLYEIENHITAFSANKKNFIIILTGGDAVFLAKRLKNTIFANSNFLLESLYHLYQFQQK